MRWAAREVVILAVAGGLSVAACGSEFSGVKDDGSAGTAGNAGANASGNTNSGGSNGGGGSVAGSGGKGPVAGSGGKGTEPVPGGTSGSAGSQTGEGGELSSMGGGGAGGTDPEPECEVELLTNGGFDKLTTGWTQMAEPARGLILHQSSDVLMDLRHQPVSPEYALLLGGHDYDISAVSQPISVPDDALILVIGFYLHIDTLEGGNTAYDFLTLGLSDGDNAPLPIASYSNQDVNDDWEPFSITLEASLYRGKNLTFMLSSTSDDDVDTTFLLDSVSITAKRCDP